MKPIQKIELTSDTYVEIFYDDSPDSPREWDNETKLCIRAHRRYSFPNELDFCFDCLDDDTIYGTDVDGKDITVGQNELEKLKGYHTFDLDMYEHSGIAFSLSGTGMQCRFDTSSDVGFIAVPDTYGRDAAISLAKDDIKIYNQYANGEVYGFRYMKTFPSKEIDGRTYEADDECIDSCHGYYDTKDIADNLPNEVREIFLNQLN